MKKKIIYLFIPLLFSCSEAYKVYEVTGVVLDIDENAKSILVACHSKLKTKLF